MQTPPRAGQFSHVLSSKNTTLAQFSRIMIRSFAFGILLEDGGGGDSELTAAHSPCGPRFSFLQEDFIDPGAGGSSGLLPLLCSPCKPHLCSELHISGLGASRLSCLQTRVLFKQSVARRLYELAYYSSSQLRDAISVHESSSAMLSAPITRAVATAVSA